MNKDEIAFIVIIAVVVGGFLAYTQPWKEKEPSGLEVTFTYCDSDFPINMWYIYPGVKIYNTTPKIKTVDEMKLSLYVVEDGDEFRFGENTEAIPFVHEGVTLIEKVKIQPNSYAKFPELGTEHSDRIAVQIQMNPAEIPDNIQEALEAKTFDYLELRVTIHVKGEGLQDFTLRKEKGFSYWG